MKLRQLFQENSPNRESPGPYVAVICALMGLGFLYWGVRGFIALRSGDRSSIADPLACTIGVLAGPWMLSVALRLVVPRMVSHRLLAGPELVILSGGAIVGGLWCLFVWALPFGVVSSGLGVLGLSLWNARRRAATTSKPTV